MRTYHRHVQRGIKLFGEDASNKDLFLNVTIGGTIIRIHHPTRGSLAPLEYKPDAIITSRNRRKIVFQVLDSQARKNREIEADMFRAFLSWEVSMIVFVTDSQMTARNVDRIWSIVSGILAEYKVEARMMPKAAFLVIPRNIRSPESAFSYLNSVRSKLRNLIASL